MGEPEMSMTVSGAAPHLEDAGEFPRGPTNGIERIARVCHEANRAWKVSCGNVAGRAWDASSDGMRRSVIAGVIEALRGSSPEEMHRKWVAYKLAEGWRLGPVIDEGVKEHPNLVPYEDLPEEERRKDELFVAIVGALR